MGGPGAHCTVTVIDMDGQGSLCDDFMFEKGGAQSREVGDGVKRVSVLGRYMRDLFGGG